MNVFEQTISDRALPILVGLSPQDTAVSAAANSQRYSQKPSQNRRKTTFDPLHSLKQRLDSIEVKSPKFARLLCQLIPAQCPFEREVKIFDRTLFYIPPLCKLNPIYEQLIGLRFRALCYLADVCGEDVTAYC
ncbi:MAG: Mo-dependent nitrogenase C-terminal domain-containing protein [Oscillatoriaceae cyanobacterium Prado104]|jgi:hypothetical protein|nr:Mo-dependent nitrogenase C-terminal domain-containing protein [Oscillatoriaceae cyanobacterium Prado104]